MTYRESQVRESLKSFSSTYLKVITILSFAQSRHLHLIIYISSFVSGLSHFITDQAIFTAKSFITRILTEHNYIYNYRTPRRLYHASYQFSLAHRFTINQSDHTHTYQIIPSYPISPSHLTKTLPLTPYIAFQHLTS
ncbi:hypothetical protein OCU04_004829 [Sclerotinia nivalis]|uniref:Uncharacterized protein n=1 Tax=Sclerotinia nivalis TaxID=352851 RepID=A0A9X0DMD3_9HELO|nr:hypothetical protein OCU04_004829 [Sclerotinia nivalis]